MTAFPQAKKWEAWTALDIILRLHTAHDPGLGVIEVVLPMQLGVCSPDFGVFLEERDDALAFYLMLNLERYDLSDHRRFSLAREKVTLALVNCQPRSDANVWWVAIRSIYELHSHTKIADFFQCKSKQ